MAISQNSLAHIRFGFGFRPDSPPLAGLDALLLQLENRSAEALDLGVSERRGLIDAYHRASKRGDTGEAEAINQRIRLLIASDFRAELVAQVTSHRGFVERLTAFWADHFTVSARGRYLSMLRTAFVHEAIRPNLAGSFADMLVSAVTHPAMLVYLNQNSSVGPNSKAGKSRQKGLNENLAREILELHTLGVGAGYTQTDVTQFAELLTGLRFKDGRVQYQPRFAEPGAETILGSTYGGDEAAIEDVTSALRDIAERPETARHIARKLAVHFVEDHPDEDLIAHISQAYRQSGGALMAIYHALLEHPSAWTPELGKVKPPRDYIVSSFRALGFDARFLEGLSRKELRSGIAAPMTAMGQVPNRPIGPDGWPEEASSWITPATLSARIAWCTKLARTYGQDLDPRAFLETSLGDAALGNTVSLVAGSESRWEGVALALASPEFNRR